MSMVDTTVDVLDRLALEVITPVITTDQAQGDLLILATDGELPAATKPIPTAGVPLVRGQGGHVHLLLGRVLWAPSPAGGQDLGVLTVPDGSVGYLAHGDGSPASALSRDADHDLLACGPGTYVIRRQREQAEEVALVAD